MKLRGQKWVFQDGNHEIIVENAWSWTMLFSQTRIRVNAETVYSKSANFWFALDWTEAHQEAWLTQLGDETLSVQFISGDTKIYVAVTVGDRELELIDYFEGHWFSKRDHWPD